MADYALGRYTCLYCRYICLHGRCMAYGMVFPDSRGSGNPNLSAQCDGSGNGTSRDSVVSLCAGMRVRVLRVRVRIPILVSGPVPVPIPVKPVPTVPDLLFRIMCVFLYFHFISYLFICLATTTTSHHTVTTTHTT